MKHMNKYVSIEFQKMNQVKLNGLGEDFELTREGKKII